MLRKTNNVMNSIVCSYSYLQVHVYDCFRDKGPHLIKLASQRRKHECEDTVTDTRFCRIAAMAQGGRFWVHDI